jgi:NADH-quinone oxidoreductase subunit N
LIIIYFRGIIDRYTFFKIILSEFFLLLYFLIVGAYFLLSLQNFRDFFIVLEIITLGSYTLIAIKRDSRFSTYAGIQYFILGSLPSAMLILAFALFYYYGGSLVYLDFDIIFFNNN